MKNRYSANPKNEQYDVLQKYLHVVMKSIVDKFGSDIKTKSIGADRFQVKVKVCAGPTFYRWVFGSGGKIKIEGPDSVKEEYKEMLRKAWENI